MRRAAGWGLLAGGVISLLIGLFTLQPGLPSEHTVSPGIIIGCILLIAGGIFLLLDYQSRHPQAFGGSTERMGAFTVSDRFVPKVPKEGYLTAVVIGVSRGLRTAGEPEVYHVVCEYTDPVSGRKVTYSSEALKEYPGKEVIGKKVRVYPDRREAGCFYVDLKTIGMDA
ncbi:MAG: hypothetical protein Q4B09_04280 [Lachnospiraceae bacterium]|nr:hypothetical protein [Lachnospiraceae bacterium]